MAPITPVNTDRMPLHGIDLNLLRLFRRLLLTRSVSRAAQDLGLSQPAASNALARLRRQFDDALFIRTPAGMEPTPRAQMLAAPVQQALDVLDAAFSQRAQFLPQASTRRFTIGMTDIGEIYFLPALMDRLAQMAPGTTVSTARDTTLDLKQGLEQGLVDLAIGLLPQLQAGFYQRRLFMQRYVCLFRRGHALDRPRITARQFEAAEHVVVVSAGTGHGELDQMLVRSGIRRAIRLTVPHFVAVGQLLRRTDMVATVPEKLAQALAEPFGLAWTAHPVKLPAFKVGVFWHARVHQDPANRWLRELVFQTFVE